MPTLNLFYSIISPHVIEMALLNSNLTWTMHRAQVLSLERSALEEVITLLNEVKTGTQGEALQRMKSNLTKYTIMGIPIVINDSMPPSTVELRYGDTVIYRIECLAIPTGYQSKEA